MVLLIQGSQLLVTLSCNNDLTFQSPAVSLRTTGFNIQKFYMVLALC